MSTTNDDLFDLEASINTGNDEGNTGNSGVYGDDEDDGNNEEVEGGISDEWLKLTDGAGNDGNPVQSAVGLIDDTRAAFGSITGNLVNAARRSIGNATNNFNDLVNKKVGELTDAPVTPGATGGAEYTLSDTIMMVFIILGLLVLFYVILVESGVFGAVKSGVDSVMGGCGCD